jgi:hypothetical protein
MKLFLCLCAAAAAVAMADDCVLPELPKFYSTSLQVSSLSLFFLQTDRGWSGQMGVFKTGFRANGQNKCLVR